ncbi:MAG: hypothetical protein ACR2L3_02465 [Actinomycetota bacterium]
MVAEGQVPEDSPGELAGSRWQVLASADEGSWCWAFQVEDEPGGMRTYTPREKEPPPDALIGVGYSREYADTLVHGEASIEVQRVELRLDSGETIDAEMIDPPSEMDIGSRYFVVYEASLVGPAELIAYDAEGAVVQKRTINQHSSAGQVDPGEAAATDLEDGRHFGCG